MSRGSKSISTTPIKPRDVQQVLSQSQNQHFDRKQRAGKVLHKPVQAVGAPALPGGLVELCKIRLKHAELHSMQVKGHLGQLEHKMLNAMGSMGSTGLYKR